MADFNASSVTPLRYDFTAFPQDGDPSLRCTGKGIVPEPSSEKLDAFMQGMLEVTNARPTTDEEVEQALEGLNDKAYALISDVCSGKPSVEELKQLPPRILAKFTAWLLGELAPKA